MTNTYINLLIHKYRSTDIVVDSNLLILYAVGKYNPDFIKIFKRTAQYEIDDFYTLKLFLDYFNSILTCPNVLTEVSNLASALDSLVKNKFFPSFHSVITTLTEKYINSSKASSLPAFDKFGLTDSVITELGSHSYLVLTDDLPLYSYLQNLKIDVINFNHIRSEQWLH